LIRNLDWSDTAMLNFEIAERAGVTPADIDDLFKGRANANVATRLGVSMGDIEGFIKGNASASMTRCLGFKAIDAAEGLARAGGKNGAVGIVIGLLLARA
jgi:hypothetical protein